MAENHKDIQVVNGDGKDLEVSPVYEHLNAMKPKTEKKDKKKIVIPEEKKDKTKKNK